jgi:hypothetical protein
VLVRGEHARQIVAGAADRHASLIAMPTPGFLLGSVTAKVLQ